MGNVNIEILLGIIAFSFNSFLAAAVIFTNSKNSTNRLFFCLAILANAYVIVNFFSLHPPIATPENQLLWDKGGNVYLLIYWTSSCITSPYFPKSQHKFKAKIFGPLGNINDRISFCVTFAIGL
jgi:hypothetical protein